MNIIRSMYRVLTDPNRSFRERNFILMTIIALSSVFLAIVGDFITGENPVESIGLALMVVFGAVVAGVCVHKKKLGIASILIAVGVVFIAVPIAFFYGGGLTGGGVLWIVFSYMYIGLLLEGKSRPVFLAIMTVLTLAELIISYHMPHLIHLHPRKMWHIDMGISVILVSFMVYFFVRFENLIYDLEAKRSRAQAKEIEELNRSQNRFFSSMSHEIRTPINTIIGLNEMILRENASDEINENAANIETASRMLLHIINDILDMSKFESDEMTLVPENYLTRDLLSDVVNMIALGANEKGLEFSVDVSHELPSGLYGDDVRIKQILINVLNNAVKYTKEGSVRLQIQSEPLGADEVNVIFTVTDTGMGIKKENIPYLFSAFKRVDEEKNRYIEGTGLGLSIVKQFVDLMGGKINVNSVYTKGSTFIIEIPQQIVNAEPVGDLSAERNGGRVRTEHVTAFEAPHARVLVVDDTAANLLVATKLLRDTKVHVDTASGGQEALQKTFENAYDVIFMDHMMPEMDGIECLHRIRSQNGGRCRNAKIAALTANAMGDNEQLYSQAGFDGYLTKPITGAELERELYRLLPKDRVVVTGTAEQLAKESAAWIRSHHKKAATRITTESVADLPAELVKEYHIGVIRYLVKTPTGTFYDGDEIGTNGLLSFMEGEDVKVDAEAPDVDEHELFFSDQLNKATNIIHIAISSGVKNSGCHAAEKAAMAFDNVFVVDSRHLSGGQGLMVIEAARMARDGRRPEEILTRLEEMKERIYTGFIVESVQYLARSGQITSRMARITDAFMIHPVITLKKGRMKIKKLYMGAKERAYDKYVSNALRAAGRIDTRMLIIVYVGMSQMQLQRIGELVQKKVKFDEIYFQKASPAVAVNSGPGAFGLLFMTEY